MTIADATVVDLEELLAFARHSFDIAYSPDNDEANMREYMDVAFTNEKMQSEFLEPQSSFLIVRDDSGAIVGYARLRRNAEVDDKLGISNLELQRFYINPALHGSGLAPRLFQHCLDKCGNVEWLWLGVWEKNPRAIRFYEKSGFRKFGEHKFFMGPDEQTDWLMCRKVNSPA